MNITKSALLLSLLWSAMPNCLNASDSCYYLYYTVDNQVYQLNKQSGQVYEKGKAPKVGSNSEVRKVDCRFEKMDLQWLREAHQKSVGGTIEQVQWHGQMVPFNTVCKKQLNYCDKIVASTKKT